MVPKLLKLAALEGKDEPPEAERAGNVCFFFCIPSLVDFLSHMSPLLPRPQRQGQKSEIPKNCKNKKIWMKIYQI